MDTSQWDSSTVHVQPMYVQLEHTYNVHADMTSIHIPHFGQGATQL